MYYIYQVTNKINGKRYIGVTKSTPNARWSGHKRTARHNAKTDLHKDIMVFGSSNFVLNVLCFGEDYDRGVSIAEPLMIELFKPEYNMTGGGQGTAGSPRPKSLKWREEHTKRMTGNNNPIFGISRSSQWREKHSVIMKNFYKLNPDKHIRKERVLV